MTTSVFGGYFEPEFEIWSRILLSKMMKREAIMLFSQITELELKNAPERVKNLVNDIPESNIEFLTFTQEVNDLTDKYLSEKVVGKTSRPDCLHIAMATLNNADILASWNFKHIVNINRIRGYNGVNYALGYKLLEIRTPREIVES